MTVRALLLASAALLVVLLTRYAQRALALVAFPYQVADAESLILTMGMDLASGRPPYHDPNAYPWVAAIYGPLFPLFTALATTVTGVSVGAQRLVSLVATAVSALAMYWLIRRASHEWVQTSAPGPEANAWYRFAAAVCVASFVVSPFVFEWSSAGRVDMLAIMFALLAVCAATRSASAGVGTSLGVAALCCVLAIWTKQTTIAAPLAISLWLALQRRLTAAVLFCAAVGLTAAAGFAVLDLWSGGGFLKGAILANALPMLPRALADFWRRAVLLYWWYLLGALAYLWYVAKSRRPALPAAYYVTALPLTVTAAHLGASFNYLIEFLAAAAICAGVAWSWLLRDGARRGVAAPATAALLLQLAWFPLADVSPLRHLFARSVEFHYVPNVHDAARIGRLEEIAAARGGEAWTEDSSLSLRIGSRAVATPASHLKSLIRTGKWDSGEELLVEAIDRRRFSTIILTEHNYSDRIMAAVDNNYQLEHSLSDVLRGYYLYVPKPMPLGSRG